MRGDVISSQSGDDCPVIVCPVIPHPHCTRLNKMKIFGVWALATNQLAASVFVRTPQYQDTCSYQLQQATCSSHLQRPLAAISATCSFYYNLQRPFAAISTTCSFFYNLQRRLAAISTTCSDYLQHISLIKKMVENLDNVY